MEKHSILHILSNTFTNVRWFLEYVKMESAFILEYVKMESAFYPQTFQGKFFIRVFWEQTTNE